MKYIKRFDDDVVNEAVRKVITTEKDPEIKKKYDILIGKTVNVYGDDTKDKVLDFGERNALYRENNMRLPANPMGYGTQNGTYFLVLRDGYDKTVLSPTFGNKALRALESI
jgi:hypothetical protein